MFLMMEIKVSRKKALKFIEQMKSQGFEVFHGDDNGACVAFSYKGVISGNHEVYLNEYNPRECLIRVRPTIEFAERV